MNEKKICPLALIGDRLPHEAAAQYNGDRCAWWTGAECALLCAAEALGSLDTTGIICHKED